MAAKEAAKVEPKDTSREVPKDVTPCSEPIKFNSGTVYVPAKVRK